MPNIKSAIKRVSVIEKKTLRNNMIKSGYKSAVKKFEQALESGNIEEAKTLFSEATRKIDQACSKGVIVKNTAARKKSNLAKGATGTEHLAHNCFINYVPNAPSPWLKNQLTLIW